MNQLTKVFEGKSVRILGDEETPLFVLADVCKVLEIRNVSAVKKRIPEEHVRSINVLDRLGRNQQKCSLVNRYGLLDVVANSKKKSVEFKTDFLKVMGIEPQKVICKRRSEEEFLAALETAVQKLPISILKQKAVSKYNVDAYIPEINLVIEYDENDHKNYCRFLETKREKEIQRLLGCEVVRISDREPHMENISVVIGKIFEEFNRRDSIEPTYESI